jgi:aspartate-semialdehyde dehydrogenase
MSNAINIAVVGATTLQGETLVRLLEDGSFPVGQLYPLAEDDEAGGRVEFKGSHLRVTDQERFDFAKVEMAFFCAGAEVARSLVPRAMEAGCLVIDQSPEFRQESGVPLVVPEVNGDAVKGMDQGLVASPGCAAIALALALKPLQDAVGIEEVQVTTLQAVSGRGQAGVEELATQTVDLLNMRPLEPKLFPKQIAFNLYPQIEDMEENGYSTEEMKIIRELRRLLEEPELPIQVTAVRVPVFYGHSAAVRVVTRKPLGAAQARELLEKGPGLAFLEAGEGEPTPVSEGAGQDPVWVGRLRQDLGDSHGLAFWLVADNLRKGGALNAVQIAELVTKAYL